MKPTLVGLAIGLAASFLLSRVIASLIFGVSARDVMTYTGVSLLLATVALAASLIPAWRATQVDPMKTLRDE